MRIASTLNEWRAIQKDIQGQKLAFIPTMGYLHDGHLSLVERASKEADLVAISIFVNPTQFNREDDFKHYPQNIEADIEKLNGKADYLFLPQKEELYPDDYQIQVQETEISKCLEGEYRPGHFDGMLTVVLKLLNIISPWRAYFGEKDYQQYLLVKKMAQALFLNAEIIAVPTVRARDGLALSSRNARLSEKERALAPLLHELLCSQKSVADIRQELTDNGFKVDYVAEKWGRRLAAATLGEVRLIDNVVCEVNDVAMS